MVRQRWRETRLVWLSLALLLVLTALAVILTQFDLVKGALSPWKALMWGGTQFYPDAKAWLKTPQILQKLGDTVLMSAAATMTAALPALALALAGARPTRVHPFMTLIARTVGSFFRNVPLVAWAMILMLAFSQSAVTGYLALFAGSLGFLTRAFLEAIDEVGEDVVEALRSTGAGSLHVVFQAVIPASLPPIVSWLLFMVETNIRDATLVGFLTGTGVGMLFDLYYKNFDYHAASLVVLATALTVLILEWGSNALRRMIL